MAINLRKIQILILLIITSIFLLAKIKVADNVTMSMPYIYYNIPADTTNCTYDGTTWKKPTGEIWNGTAWQ